MVAVLDLAEATHSASCFERFEILGAKKTKTLIQKIKNNNINNNISNNIFIH